MTALLGTKLGMTRIFDETGRSIPVTALRIDPCVVTQCKTLEKDGYIAIQVGTGIERHPNKIQQGQSKELESVPKYLTEFRLEDSEGFSVGQVFNCSSVSIGDRVRLTGVSKGKGFSGVIKRHHFSRGPETHGSDHHRAPGSIGSMFPQHVMKGKKMPGKMGNDQVTVPKVQIVEVLSGQDVILVKGPVPGSRGSLIKISSL